MYGTTPLVDGVVGQLLQVHCPNYVIVILCTMYVWLTTQHLLYMYIQIHNIHMYIHVIM